MKIVGFFIVSLQLSGFGCNFFDLVATIQISLQLLTFRRNFPDFVATIQFPPNFIWLFPNSLLSFIIERKYETGGFA